MTTHWWQTGIVYQVYPRSFQDSNGDGVGDLPGIRQRLPYLQWLGINAVWISPIYPSPMADFGYDVSNYVDVHPLFGTLADMDALIATAHGLGLRVLLDFVPNHTSSQHPWFLESRASRDNPKRDWYVWRDARPDGSPPNNWLSRFDARSAWQWDAATGQYYLHSFLKEQPDLNWRHPPVREAMLDAMRFWLDRGVDGFRVDVPWFVMKDPLLRDNPPNPDWREGMDPFDRLAQVYSENDPNIHEFNRWLRQVVDAYDDRVLVGETYLPVAELVKHYGDDDEFHMPFNFQLIKAPWDAATVRSITESYEAALPPAGWPNWVLGNHDQHRIASRVGPRQARVAMMLLLTLRGTPTMYYGDEIGMQDVPIPPDKVQDPWEEFHPGLGLGRDPERTPMQWDGSPNAGFCPAGVEPWLPLAADALTSNMAAQSDQPASILTLTRTLIKLRRTFPVFTVGSFQTMDAPPGVLAYMRRAGTQRCLVALNFTGEERSWRLPAGLRTGGLLVSTGLDRLDAAEDGELFLRPDEGVVLQLA